MAIICAQCSQENPEQSGFCVRCGSRLQSTGQAGATFISTSLPTYASSPSNPLTPSSYSPPTGATYPSSGQGLPTYGTVAPPPPIAQMGTGQGLASIRRAFAGRGTLTMHHSWLLNGEHAYAQSGAVSSAVINMLRQRNIAGLNVNPEKLMERGLLMEERDYVTAHRGIATVFIYTASAGQDLYISRATTALPAISFVVSLLLLLMFIGFLVHPSPLALATGDVVGLILSSILSFLSYPLLLFFILLLIRSFIFWLVEKDFWVYLRSNTLNDFQMDDIALLERVIDDTVRDAVKQTGLDASEIVAPTAVQGHQLQRRRIRGI